VRTTLDVNLQVAVETLAARNASLLGDHANIAALVIANQDRSVLAYLGGADYFGSGGMVDMVRAVRSPGSALKPFIYGLAFNGGILLPESIVEDRPTRFGDYAPQSFDRVFHGAVTAREALQQSYNAPAVQLLDEIGPAKVAATLRLSGIRLAFPRGAGEPGLPLALGGVGVTLGDLAVLYAGLANVGKPALLRFVPDAPLNEAAPLMTANSARMVTEILRGVPPPDGTPSKRTRAIAYKTGTSYGFRDALAIGYSTNYTVAVWVGRTDGTPRPGSYGRNTAAPLLFEIFELLPQEPPGDPPHPPTRVTRPLAAGLRRFAPSKAQFGFPTPPATPPRITFPPSGARLDLARTASGHVHLVLEASGGAPPYRWIVNGQPLPPGPVGAPAVWNPDGPGLVRISVTDKNNTISSTEAWIQ
jgi:penicillin-binding protein 1C